MKKLPIAIKGKDIKPRFAYTSPLGRGLVDITLEVAKELKYQAEVSVKRVKQRTVSSEICGGVGDKCSTEIHDEIVITLSRYTIPALRVKIYNEASLTSGDSPVYRGCITHTACDEMYLCYDLYMGFPIISRISSEDAAWLCGGRIWAEIRSLR